MDGISIRRCVASDAASLAAMYAADRDEFDAREDESFFTAEGQVERITSIWTTYNCVGFVVSVDSRVVGLFVLEDIADGSTTVGYYVGAFARGRGVATEALSRVVEIARDELGLREVRAGIDPANLASRRVLEHNGFTRAGRAGGEDVFVLDIS